MDKFLDLVEDHTPDDSIGRNTEIKVMLYKTLNKTLKGMREQIFSILKDSLSAITLVKCMKR